MFTEPTVFILGAGASCHYGYPTGEELVRRLVGKCSQAEDYFEHSIAAQVGELPNYLGDLIKAGHQSDALAAWNKGLEEVRRLKAGLLQVNPLVIDYFLGWNLELKEIGRLLIAWVILECEYNARSGPGANDDWLRFIIHQLAIHCEKSKDLLSNHINFITFNYDVSLERTLRNGLRFIKLFEVNDVNTFLSGSRIIHVYGRVRDGHAPAQWPIAGGEHLTPKNITPAVAWQYRDAMKKTLDVAYQAAKGLRVIDPHDKGSNDDDLMMARRAIHDAKRVFILGYGFDEHNSERLGLRDYLRHTVSPGFKSVAFTNFEDRGTVNKRASKLFYGGVAKEMLAGGHQLVDRYEKSVRNTYDALAWDFDLAS